MSRHIDAEWIRNVYADFEHYDNRNDWTTPITNVLAVIDDAPSIDIVFCKECKHRGICFGKLVQGTEVVQLNFCSYGERESE